MLNDFTHSNYKKENDDWVSKKQSKIERQQKPQELKERTFDSSNNTSRAICKKNPQDSAPRTRKKTSKAGFTHLLPKESRFCSFNCIYCDIRMLKPLEYKIKQTVV